LDFWANFAELKTELNTYLFTKQTDSKRSTAQFCDILTGIDENVIELFSGIDSKQ
jgi:hypothetical protein